LRNDWYGRLLQIPLLQSIFRTVREKILNSDAEKWLVWTTIQKPDVANYLENWYEGIF